MPTFADGESLASVRSKTNAAIEASERNPSATQRGAPLKSTSAENAVGTAQDKYPDVAGVREMIAEHANGAVNVVSLTAAEYAAITDPDVNTIYLVTS